MSETYHILIAYPEHMADFNGDAYCDSVTTSEGYEAALAQVRANMAEDNDWVDGDGYVVGKDEKRKLRVLIAVKGGELL